MMKCLHGKLAAHSTTEKGALNVMAYGDNVMPNMAE